MNSTPKISLPSISSFFTKSKLISVSTGFNKNNDIVLPSLASLNLPYPRTTRNGSLPLIAPILKHYPSRTASFDASLLNNWEYSSSLQQGSSPEERSKRHRRLPEEIARYYKCLHPNCDKSYGILNHLNSHIQTQNHGKKQLPAQYRELRLALRRQRRLQKACFTPINDCFYTNQQ